MIAPEIAERLRQLGAPEIIGAPGAPSIERLQSRGRAVRERPARARTPTPVSALAPIPASAPAPALKPNELALLTLTERRALGLPQSREAKRDKAGRYRFVLVTFANRYRQLVGMYPRAKDPDSLVPAMASARARYLLILSGGNLLDASKGARVPKIVSARVVDEPQELENERHACGALRDCLEAFSPGYSHAPREHGPDVYTARCASSSARIRAALARDFA